MSFIFCTRFGEEMDSMPLARVESQAQVRTTYLSQMEMVARRGNNILSQAN